MNGGFGSERAELLIVGGGLASARAIRAYRDAGGDGRIVLVSGDSTLPYHRPPLSKRFLRGEVEAKDTLVEAPGFYDDHAVDVALETAAVGVDTREHAVETAAGRRLRYRKLLLASGSVPRALPVDGADLAGVFTLRSLDDSAAIRAAAAEARDAVVVGSGFVGMEVAASLTQLGLDVTLVSRDVDLFAQLGSPEISDHLVRLYREHGVEVVLGEDVRAFRGARRLDTVELARGEPVGAGLAVVGVGVVPATSFLQGSGITVDDGVLVDERFQTNVPGVYAAGDVARFFDPLYARLRRVEHWSNASHQGSEVGKVLAGAEALQATVSTFFTESFGVTLKVFGDTSVHDDRLVRGSFESGSAIAFYLEGHRLVAALHTGLDEEAEGALRGLIGARVEDRTLLADESVPLVEAYAAAPAA